MINRIWATIETSCAILCSAWLLLNYLSEVVASASQTDLKLNEVYTDTGDNIYFWGQRITLTLCIKMQKNINFLASAIMKQYWSNEACIKIQSLHFAYQHVKNNQKRVPS